MKISFSANYTSQNQQPNFKSANIIQISKKAFQNPDNLVEVSNTFAKKVNEITGEVHNNFMDSMLGKFGLKGLFNKTAGYLEQPRYLEMIKRAKEEGADLFWLSKNAEIPIKTPPCEDKHSFYVFTKGEKDKFVFAKKISRNCEASYINAYACVNKVLSEDIAELRDPDKKLLRENQNLLELIESFMTNKQIDTFSIDDLSELPKIFKQIDY